MLFPIEYFCSFDKILFMKTRLFLLLTLLLFQISFGSNLLLGNLLRGKEIGILDVNPVAPNLSNLVVCDNNNDSFSVFDLTLQNITILSAQTGSASDYNIFYYETLTDAAIGGNNINNPSSYYNVSSYNQVVYFRITHIPTNDFAVGSFNLVVNNAPFATGPQIISTCDDYDNPYDGIYALDLTQFASSILGGQNPSTHLISYYTTQADAIYGTNQILLSQAQSFVTASAQVWVKVTNSSGCYALTTINIGITSYPNPVITSSNGSNIICVDLFTDSVFETLTLNSNVSNPSDYTFQWYENGLLLVSANASFYTVNIASLNGGSRSYSVSVISNSSLSCETTSSSFVVNQSGQAAIPVNSNGYTIVNLSDVQMITVDIVGYGTYQYSLDNGLRQDSNVFENVSLGSHSISVWDTEGGMLYSCDPLIITDVLIEDSQVPAPTGSSSQSFTSGATLSNIVVNGTNVQWYGSPTSASPLPLNTVLVNGTTYYATQTVTGIQSAARLAVTVQLSLGTDDNEILPIRYFPNPVKNNLTLVSSVVLKSVAIYTILGQKIVEHSFQDINVVIDLSHLSSGNYILKAQGETGQSIVRIIKE
jgi:hypothetical protein